MHIKQKTPTPDIGLLRQIVLDPDRDLPLHAQLRQALERLIQHNFEDQQRFFSESQLIRSLSVSQGTIRRTLGDLAAMGLLEKHPARGAVVCKVYKPSGLLNLSIFLPDYSSSTISQILGHLNAECMNRDIQLQLIHTHRGERLLTAYKNLKFSPQEGGVVLLNNSPNATMQLLTALEGKGYNCVVIGTLLRNLSCKFVGGCNQTVSEVALNHLVERGHRNIALLVNEPYESENVQERVAAFKHHADRLHLGIRTRVVHCGTQFWENAYEAVERVMGDLMMTQDRPTALLAVSDVGAIAAIKWLQKEGIKVPEEMSVMGTDGSDIGAMIHPSLTSLEHPADETTMAVFELLENRESKLCKIFTKPSLIVRESTAEPPHHPL